MLSRNPCSKGKSVLQSILEAVLPFFRKFHLRYHHRRSQFMTEKLKILVVEDNDFVRMQIVRYLKDSEYEVAEAKDGNEALQMMDKDISLAIVDMRMEPMSGLDFVRALRGKKNETPVIFVTGDDNSDLLEQASKWGVGAVLMKPVMKDRLIMAVKKTIALRNRA
jgi:CheY-like chemotaxis protein